MRSVDFFFESLIRLAHQLFVHIFEPEIRFGQLFFVAGQLRLKLCGGVNALFFGIQYFEFETGVKLQVLAEAFFGVGAVLLVQVFFVHVLKLAQRDRLFAHLYDDGVCGSRGCFLCFAAVQQQR